MRLGLCCPIQEIPLALEAGFDYVEIPCVSLADDAVFSIADGQGWPILATNLFFPHEAKVYQGGWEGQVAICMARAALLGVQTMVVGSGRQRSVPQGMTVREAEDLFMEIIAELDQRAAASGMRLAPENLRLEETDVFTSYSHLASAARAHRLSVTLDSYHLAHEPGRDWGRLVPAVPDHVHLAGPGRGWPVSEDPFLQGFLWRLKELGYSGPMSLECNMPGPPSMGLAETVRSIFDEAWG